MANKSVNPPVEEFEPLCQWERKDDSDILQIHLKEFKKEELKVQISNLGILKISGERPLDASRKSKFYKEVPIPKNCDSNGIRAKFVNGSLFIVMPKKVSISGKQEAPHQSTNQDQTRKESDQKQETTSADAKPAEKTPTVSEFQPPKRAVRRLRTCSKVVVTLATLAALIAYVVYMYRAMSREVVEYF